MADSVLLVDDDPTVLKYLTTLLERSGFDPVPTSSGESGIAAYRAQRPTVVLLDLDLPGISGLEVLEQLRTDGAAVIILTGEGSIETAVQAMQFGAQNFLTKPVDPAHLLLAVARAAESVRSRRQLQLLTDSVSETISLEALGSAPDMLDLARQIRLIAESDRTKVLITGESGTGKGWVARLIHKISSRADAPLVSINCAGLMPTLLNSELFGHERGAFTDAREMKRGLFEIADKGALFLDEIGELSSELQPKLLDVLETHRFRRLGGTRELRVDVRLITATNKDLAGLVAQGAFREDLYYRLSVMPLHLPPVRERSREDRLLLINRLLADLTRELPDAPTSLTPAALERLLAYSWPGNVRGMKNVLERALILSRGLEEIGLEHLTPEVVTGGGTAPSARQKMTLAEVERDHIERMLGANRGNRAQTARELGIGRATLLRKIKQYGIG